MMTLLGNLLLVVLFAWVARALLGTREVTWPRAIVAVLVGTTVGAAAAALLLVDVTAPLDELVVDVEERRSDLAALALPFQVVATMLAVVVIELLAARPSRPGPRRPWGPRRLRRWFGTTARAARVTRIVVRHGLAPALGLKRGDVPTRDPAELARRARLALEDAGGMFVKLGQLLATRPDLLPPAALAELGQLHAAARPLERAEVEQAISAEVARPLEEVFTTIDWTPLGSASIAQVHTARLHDGRDVVIKVRRPGLLEAVERDLSIAVGLARSAERSTAWGRSYEVGALAEDFARALRTELDLRVEGRHAAEMAGAAARRHGVVTPSVVDELTTERLLVMDRLVGVPLSAHAGHDLDPDTARHLAGALCASQVEAMLEGERFHGDPHPGNVLLLDDGTLGLIDFGATGRLDAFERASVFQLLLSLRLGEPSLLYESLVAIGSIPPTRDPDDVERTLARFMTAHLGAGLPSADALTELLRLSTRLGFRLPPQTSTMFRALATLAGTLELLCPGFPLIDEVAAIGGEELRDRTSPSSIGELVQREWVQMGPLVRRAPRHLDRIATLIEHGGVTARVRLFSEASDVAVAERLLNRAILAALALGLGIIAVLSLATDAGPALVGTDVALLEVLGWIGLFGAAVLFLRVLLEVLRPPHGGGR